MEFYKILEEIMEEKQMNIPEVARACGLSDGTVRSIMVRKSKNVSLEVAFKLADGLGVSLERLNGMQEQKKAPETVETETGDKSISVQELTKMLVEYGFVKDNQDISDKDLRFFLSVGEAIRSWLANRQD